MEILEILYTHDQMGKLVKMGEDQDEDERLKARADFLPHQYQ